MRLRFALLLLMNLPFLLACDDESSSTTIADATDLGEIDTGEEEAGESSGVEANAGESIGGEENAGEIDAGEMYIPTEFTWQISDNTRLRIKSKPFSMTLEPSW